ncbi:hypothetical protein Aple_095460 [Acrocarpospora pleiomorpha]|uniref:Uncharacterized protein n=1 Tax=Acrocarpospora pleiomorpha TaxID=90975 RepID=A0A5M3XZW5_9ACTN|nr:hypothetical protein Aple_095460 [Acrocarpospora pleiomorpha]
MDGDCAEVERVDEERVGDCADEEREVDEDDEREDGESWEASRRAVLASLMAAFFALPLAFVDFLFGLSGIVPPVVGVMRLLDASERLIPISAG